MDIVLGLLAACALLGTFATMEADRRTRAMIGLFVANASVGLIFLYLNAVYAGLFQLLIYAGVLVILFLSTAALLEVQEEGEEGEKHEKPVSAGQQHGGEGA